MLAVEVAPGATTAAAYAASAAVTVAGIQSIWKKACDLGPVDLIIVDEASKTLIQEFLVPALMARRWIMTSATVSS